MPNKVLILAGTAEARVLCDRVQGFAVTARLAGRTEGAGHGLPVPTEIGGFGGEAGFRAALPDYTAIVDATHPYAAEITERTARICAETHTPYLRLTRAPWDVQPDWSRHPTADACADALPTCARVFLTTGPGSLTPFLNRDLHLVCRRVDPAPPIPGVEWVVGLPGTETAEFGLMRALGVTHLVTKNSGGARRGKLNAANRLGLSIHIIDRPAPPPGEETYDIDRAAAFVADHAPH